MEKNLLLIRHSTAEDVTNSSMVRDIDRELTSRGIMESARVGKYLIFSRLFVIPLRNFTKSFLQSISFYFIFSAGKY